MAFYSRTFVFNNVPSENYSLTISSTSGGEETTNMAGGGVKLYTEKLYRRTEEYLLGSSIDEMLTFPVTIMTDNVELTARDAALVGSWLFGRNQYGKLQVMQPDMTELHYDCFFLDPKIIRVGNIIRGFSANIKCKTPWAVTEEKTFIYTGVGSFIHNCASDHTSYTYPTTIITANSFGGTLTIVNTSDANRKMEFLTISPNEVLTIDNNRQILTSSTGLRRLSLFNKNFFRLKKGINNLTISGNVASTIIKYSLARKIGG